MKNQKITRKKIKRHLTSIALITIREIVNQAVLLCLYFELKGSIITNNLCKVNATKM